jgi:hypothetical protein
VAQRRSVNTASQGCHGHVRELSGHTVSFDLLAQRYNPPGQRLSSLRFVGCNSQNAAQMHRSRNRQAVLEPLGPPRPGLCTGCRLHPASSTPQQHGSRVRVVRVRCRPPHVDHEQGVGRGSGLTLGAGTKRMDRRIRPIALANKIVRSMVQAGIDDPSSAQSSRNGPQARLRN